MELPMPDANPLVAYPLRKESVPNWAALILAYGVPLVGIVLAQVPALVQARRSGGPLLSSAVLHELHHFVLALLESSVLASFATGIGKQFGGRHRPNYLALVPYGKSAEIEGRKSFPSGHASSIFTGMCFLAMWLAGRIGVFRADRSGEFWKMLVAMSPLGVAFLVALSRTRDGFHNFSDIAAGAFIGILSAVANYLSTFSIATGTPKVIGAATDPDQLPVTSKPLIDKQQQQQQQPRAVEDV
jgi:membrane-associated phospholipid phosphatase